MKSDTLPARQQQPIPQPAISLSVESAPERAPERLALVDVLPELRAEQYADVVRWDAEIAAAKVAYTVYTGERLAQIRAVLTSGRFQGTGAWSRYLAYRGINERTARYRIQKAEGRYVRSGTAATVAAVSSREPEPESPTLAAIRAAHERAILGDAALVDSQPAEIQAAVLADLEAGAKGNVRWRVNEARRAVLREANRRLIEEQGVPVSRLTGGGTRYPTVVIDPPWDWLEQAQVLGWGAGTALGRAEPDYVTMPTADIAALPLADLAADHAHLYLWIDTPRLYCGVARDLLTAWGFRYGTVLTWDKQSFGIGQTFRPQTEHCVVGYRGSLPLLNHNTATIFQAPRPPGRPHSGKPDAFYALVQRCSPGPWLELFSRQVRGPGWVRWGQDGIAGASERVDETEEESA